MASESKAVSLPHLSILLPGLTILFVGLKLTDQIDWNWFWVLSPTLISAIFWTLVILVVGIVTIIKK